MSHENILVSFGKTIGEFLAVLRMPQLSYRVSIELPNTPQCLHTSMLRSRTKNRFIVSAISTGDDIHVSLSHAALSPKHYAG